jgi:CubicO group peptidase (beta-lactamase class C family)
MLRLVASLAAVAFASLPAANAQRSTGQSSLYFPGDGRTWESVSPQQAGWHREHLDSALDYAGTVDSTAVVAVHNGRILAERYWSPGTVPRIGSTPEGWPIEDVASLQKSIVSLLVGIAVDRRLVQREASVAKYLGAGWSRAPIEAEAKITVNHLLTMTSGLTEPGLEYEVPAGSLWFYNTAAYSQLIKVMTSVAGKEPNRFTAEWLTTRMAMTDTRWVLRQGVGAGAAVNPYGLVTTARDLARVGILVLTAGMWQGERIVSESYIREAVRPSQPLNASYGLLWYVNQHQAPAGIQPILSVSAAPTDLVAAFGAGQRRVYVVPSLRLVVVRLGAASPRFDEEFLPRVMKAAPTR